MMRSIRPMAVLVAACLAAGCALPTTKRQTGVTAETTLRGPKIGGAQRPDAATTAPSVPAGGLISNNGGSVISNNSAGLSGIVRCPANLLSNNGAGIISDNGLGYRVTAESEVVLKKVTVRLLDAAGRAATDKDGKALTTTTDTAGHYVFPGVVPISNLIIAVDLGAAGQLSAIAPKSGADERKADLSLISTLTTRYILSQYVKGQADPQKTLDKLPPDVEAQTRTKAAAAFAASGQATPADLKEATVQQVVAKMREKDTSFDAQMETVKKILIAAGLSDLGNGQVATDVLLGNIGPVVGAPDGSVYLHDGAVVWRVTPQGMLQRLTAAGPADTALDGKKAVDTRLGPVEQMALDAQGRLWVLQDGQTPKLLRLEADGTLKDVGRGLTPIAQFTPTGNDDFVAILQPATWGGPVPIYECTGTAAPRLAHTVTGPDATLVASFQQLARDAQGRLLGSGTLNVYGAYRLDLTTKTLTVAKKSMTDGAGTVIVDPSGTLFYDELATHQVHAVKPDGADALVPGLTHLPFSDGVAAGADGAVFVTGVQHGNSLYRVKAGAETLWAGKETQGTETGGSATTTALQSPDGLAVAGDGTLYVTDGGALLRIHPTEGTSTLIAVNSLQDGTTPLNPKRPQLGSDGWVYFIGTVPFGTTSPLSGVWRVKPGSAPEKVHGSDRHVEDYLLATDGSMTIAESTQPGPSGTVLRVSERSASGVVTPLIAETDRMINQAVLTRDAQNRLLILGSRKGTAPNTYDFNRIFRFTTASGIELLSEDTFWPEARNARGLEVQAFYYTSPQPPKTVRVRNPATNAVETLAGAGGRFFTGSGVDDGLLKPMQPAFDAQGNLFFLDVDNKQVKRIPASGI